MRVKVRNTSRAPAPADRLINSIVGHRPAAFSKPVTSQVSALVRFADTLIPVESPRGLVAERHDAGTPPFACHVCFAQLDTYMLSFQPGKFRAAHAGVQKQAHDGEITPRHEIAPIASLAKRLDLFRP